MKELIRFLEWTAWPMEEPPAYGVFHLSFMLAGFAVSILAAWRLRRAGERENRWIVFGVGVFLAVTEVYKQMMHLFVLSPGDYDWGAFPFQLCSVPMYLCLIAPWLRDGRMRQSMYGFMTTYNFLGGFIAFFEPSGLLHDRWMLTLHSCVWHMVLVFLGLYLVFSGRVAFEKGSFARATVLFLALSALAFGGNLALWEISQGQINLFFLGPRNSPLIVFETIAQCFGWYASTAVYIPAVCLGAWILFRLFAWVSRRFVKNEQKEACCG